MTKEEFLADLVHFYGSDPSRRAVNSNGSCVYSPIKTRSRDSPGCAIGRYLICDLKTKKKFDDKALTWNIVVSQNPDLKLLPDWMEKYPVRFLRQCQMLHDDNNNWKKGNELPLQRLIHEIIRDFELSREAYEEALNKLQNQEI